MRFECYSHEANRGLLFLDARLAEQHWMHELEVEEHGRHNEEPEVAAARHKRERQEAKVVHLRRPSRERARERKERKCVLV